MERQDETQLHFTEEKQPGGKTARPVRNAGESTVNEDTPASKLNRDTQLKFSKEELNQSKPSQTAGRKNRQAAQTGRESTVRQPESSSSQHSENKTHSTHQDPTENVSHASKQADKFNEARPTRLRQEAHLQFTEEKQTAEKSAKTSEKAGGQRDQKSRSSQQAASVQRYGPTTDTGHQSVRDTDTGDHASANTHQDPSGSVSHTSKQADKFNESRPTKLRQEARLQFTEEKQPAKKTAKTSERAGRQNDQGPKSHHQATGAQRDGPTGDARHRTVHDTNTDNSSSANTKQDKTGNFNHTSKQADKFNASRPTRIKQATRLQFTEEELANEQVAKAARKADKKADKADRAAEKLPMKRKLRRSPASAEHAKGQLHFERETAPVPTRTGQKLTRAPLDTVSGTAHRKVSQYEEDNVGVEAAHHGEQTAERALHTVDHASYSHKLQKYKRADRAMKQSDRANINALYRNRMARADNISNPVTRMRQKRQIKKEYAAMKRTGQTAWSTASATGKTAKNAGKAAKETKTVATRVASAASKHPLAILVAIFAVMILMVITGTISSCTVLFGGTSDAVVVETSFTAEDEDILGAEEDYVALENNLREQIDTLESTSPGYDEYRYDLSEIGHNPIELTAYLTILYEDFTRNDVQSELQSIFDAQYELITQEEVEVRTRTEIRTGERTVTETDPDTGKTTTYTEEYEYEVEVEYEYCILNVTLTNHDLSAVIGNAGFTDDDMSRYVLLLETSGNKPELFEDNIYANQTEGLVYEVPPEALEDERFARMLAEAEKYLGYPYVWGGSSPSTSFDCSGFVCWVINNCGNGWSVGRQSANALKNLCTIIAPTEAQPGDLIFFQGTYSTSGASHVGIYVGNGMMIHAGSPIQYASVNSNYWQQHFLCYGRLP